MCIKLTRLIYKWLFDVMIRSVENWAIQIQKKVQFSLIFFKLTNVNDDYSKRVIFNSEWISRSVPKWGPCVQTQIFGYQK